MTDKKLLIIGSLLIFTGLSGVGLAQTESSPSYQLNESFIGPGGTVNSSSPSYSESSTAGDIGVGNSSSTSYQTNSGFNTTNDPRLSLVVNTSSINFGSLSTSAATTSTSTFSVLNYTSSGYSVFTIGNPPTNSGHSLANMGTTGPSQTGTEQFGINLKANTSPVSFGADPVQVPGSGFSYGAASTGYDSANNYRYVAGEEIAHASQQSGETDYTISYIVNVSNVTPGGVYTGSQILVVVGTY